MSNKAPKPLAEAVQYCPTSAWKKIQNEAIVLLDVREDEEVEQLRFAVPHYLHIPLSQLEQRFHEVPKEPSVIVACLDGERSLKATYFLSYQGYLNVANMRLGLARWVEKGFPVIGDPELLKSGDASGNAGCCC